MCNYCEEERQDTEKVSARLHPPDGAVLCRTCLIPASVEAQQKAKDNEV